MLFSKSLKDSPCTMILTLQKHFKKYCDNQLEHDNLTNNSYMYLIYINRYPKCSLMDLSTIFNIDKSYVTRVINKLESEKFINKIQSKKDSRSYELTLTKSGELAMKKIQSLFIKWNKEIEDNFTKEEFQQLNTLLHKAISVKFGKQIK